MSGNPPLPWITPATPPFPRVRHEAGEALGAIGTRPCLAILHDHVEDGCLEVAQTCQLAVQRIEYFQGQRQRERQGAASPSAGDAATPEATEETEERRRYLSVDPTPPAPAATPTPELAATLADERARIFDRYRAMFALRDRGGADAVAALGAAFGSCSALLKHEVAYVLGQMQDARGAACLARVLADAGEAAMVRHEAAEALGAIADDGSLGLLRRYAADPEPIVADSCVVALDMLEFERSGGFQYADDGREDGGAAAAGAPMTVGA